jgi:hypothetical protein
VVVQAHPKTQETRHAAEARYGAKLALVKSLYRRGWNRSDILELFRCIDWMLRLPEALEERIWSEMQDYEKERKMPYVTSVERIGIRTGVAEGVAHERQLLLRLIRKRFGPAVGGQSQPLLGHITDAQPLEDLGEALLDSPDGATWLQVLGHTAERTAREPPDHP